MLLTVADARQGQFEALTPCITPALRTSESRLRLEALNSATNARTDASEDRLSFIKVICDGDHGRQESVRYAAKSEVKEGLAHLDEGTHGTRHGIGYI